MIWKSFLLLSISWTATLQAGIRIVPKPLSVTEHRGTFVLSAHTELSAPDTLRQEALLFAEYLAPTLGGRMTITRQPGPKNVTLALDPALEPEEYILMVSSRSILLHGGAPKGVFYGLQTLRQLAVENSGQIPALEIRDKPDLAYRGASLDVSRHFFPVGDIKRYLDIMALHKLNRFHWHLTDDQGWRIEIKCYPQLTAVGSQRKETLVGVMRKDRPLQFDGTPYGGYYTQDEVREIVAYAAARHIEVIPEIDMPGHGLGALAAYPWLGCTGGPYEVWTRWGVSEDVYCPGRETTFEFIENVLSEVLELFPSELIHIGGDECPKTRWENCPKCQDRIRNEALKDETALQSYFVRRIERWLQARGREIVGWDEILDGGISPTATIMVWRDPRHALDAVRHGNRVILCPKQYCYLDYCQTADPERYEPPCHDSRYVPLRQVYRLEPFDQLRPEEQSRIFGVQANVWTEYMPDMACVEHMILPRMAAVAEIGWACNRKSYNDFRYRLNGLAELYASEDYRYADFVFRHIE